MIQRGSGSLDHLGLNPFGGKFASNHGAGSGTELHRRDQVGRESRVIDEAEAFVVVENLASHICGDPPLEQLVVQLGTTPVANGELPQDEGPRGFVVVGRRRGRDRIVSRGRLPR